MQLHRIITTAAVFILGFTIQAAAQEHFEFVRTDNNHSMIITEAILNDAPLPVDDEVGVFTPAGLCAGASVIIEEDVQFGLAAWGDEAQQVGVNGFFADEEFSFRFWDVEIGEEIEAAPDFEYGPEAYVFNGFTVLSLTGEWIDEPEPDIEIDDDGIDFGYVEPGESETLPVIIRNVGDADLTIRELIIVGEDEEVPFTTQFDDEIVMSPDDVLNQEVTFAPEEEMECVAVMIIISDDPDEEQIEILLEGTGIPPLPQIYVSDNAYDFGEVTLDDRVEWEFTIRNDGEALLSIESVVTEGDGFDDNIDDGFELEAGGEQIVTVGFQPDEEGEYSGMVTITSDDGDNPEIEIELTGVGTVQQFPEIVADPDAVDFGDVPVNGQGSESLTIINAGGAPLTITGVTVDDDAFRSDYAVVPVRMQFHFEYLRTDNNHSIILQSALWDDAPLQTGCEIGLITPRGICAGETYIEDPEQDIGIAAWGDEAQTPEVEGFQANDPFLFVYWDPTTASEVEAEAEFIGGDDFYVVNGLSIARLSATGGAHRLDETTTLIHPDTAIEVGLWFEPNQAGEYGGALLIESDDPDRPELEVELQGVGIEPQPQITLFDDHHNFGRVRTGSSARWTFVVRNTGQAALNVESVETEGDYFTDDQDEPFRLEPDQEQAVVITFAPEDEGEYAGTVTITSNDPERNTVEIGLSGFGTDLLGPVVVVEPASLQFGEVPVDELATTVLTIGNDGDLDLHLDAVESGDHAFWVEYEGQGPHFRFESTDGNHSFLVTEASLNGEDLAAGNEIGVFTPGGFCAGGVVIINPGAQIGLAAWADEALSQEIEGFRDGEEIDFRYWDAQGRLEIQAEPNFLQGPERYALNGVTIITLSEAEEMRRDDVAEVVIEPGESIEVTVFFQPDEDREYVTNLTIFSDDADNPELDIELTGEGILEIPEIGVPGYEFDFFDNFMATPIGESDEWTFPITNNGHADLVVESVVTEGLYFTDDIDEGFVLEPDESRMVTVTFAPEQEGEFFGTATILSNDPNNGELVIELSGVGILPPPVIYVEDGSHDFGEVMVGMQDEWRLVIVNRGESVLIISEVTVTGDCFSVDFMDEIILQPDESAWITVYFRPEDVGVFLGELTLISNDPENEQLVIRLMGEAVGFPIIAGDDAVDFGEVPVGEIGEQFYTINNDGLEPLIVENAYTESNGFTVEFEVEPRDFDWEFETSDNNMSIIVETATINDESLVEGDLIGTFTENGLCAGFRQVTDEGFPVGVAAWGDDPNGEGITGFIADEPLNFRIWDMQAGREWTADAEAVNGETIYVINALIIVRLEADRPIGVQQPDDIAEMIIARGESRDIRVLFEPTEAQEYEGVMTITSSDPFNPEFNVDLRGTGISLPPHIVVSDLAHDFGYVMLNRSVQWIFTISNDGASELIVEEVVTEGDYFADDIDQPIQLDRGDVVDVTVTFAPGEAGDFEGAVTITSNDPNHPELTVELSGTGVVEEIPDLTLDQDALDFGRIPIGDFRVLDLTGSNIGNADLNITEINIQNDAFTTDFDPEQGITVHPDGDFTVQVIFQPEEAGMQEGTLTIISDDPDEGESIIDLTGEALPEGNHFAYAITGENMSAIIQEALLDGENLVENDEIGVFTPGALCAGAVKIADEWPVGLSIWGDDPTTDPVDGFDGGEPLEWRYWDRSAGREYNAVAEYLDGVGNYNTNALIILALSVRLEEAPVMRLSADRHDFGRVAVDNTERWILTVSNVGDAVLTVESIASDNEVFTIAGFDPETEIMPGGRISVEVQFSPVEAMLYEGSLLITSNDADHPEVTVELTGQGIEPAPPAIELSAHDHAFGDVVVNDQVAWDLVVTNTGGDDLTVLDLNLAGAAFSIDPSEGFVLGIDESAVIHVSFAPQDQVRYEGRLTVFSNDPDHPRSEVALTGRGVAPEYHWNFQITDNNMSLILREIRLDNQPMAFGSQVGVFTTNGTCAGANVIYEYPVGLAAWGDVVETEDEVEGFVNGEEMSFKVWDVVTGLELDAAANYHVGNGEYVANELWILSLSAFLPLEEMHFRGFLITDVNHSLLVQEATLDDEFLAVGDEVGVFTPGGILAGAEQLENPGDEPFGIAAWGDDRGTPAVDGFVGGDEIIFRYWDNDTGREYPAFTEWIDGPETYEDNGLSLLSLHSYAEGEPEITVEREHDFGRIHVGDAGSWDMVIRNQGDGILEIEEMSGLAVPFSINFQAPLAIEPGGQAQLTVRFNPLAVRAYEDRLIITTNDLENHEVWVSLFGEGYVEQGRPVWIELPEDVEGLEGEHLEFDLAAEDPDGDPIEIHYDPNGIPEEAVFVDHEDGTGTFTWDVGYEDSGDYEAFFTLVSGEFQVAGIVQITIVDVNRSPIIIGEIPDVQIPEDFGFREIVDLDNVIMDPDQDPLEFIVEGIDELNLEIDADHVLSLSPEPDYFGSSLVTIIASDNRGGMQVMALMPHFRQGSDVNLLSGNQRMIRAVNPDAEFGMRNAESLKPVRDDEVGLEFGVDVLPVNDDPVWVEYPNQITVDEGALIEFNVRAEDIDLDQLRLSVTGGDLPEEAQFTDNGDGTGSFEWQTDFFSGGEYVPTLVVSDGQAEDVVEVTITVNNVNRDPMIVEPSEDDVYAVQVDEGQDLTIDFNAVDPDLDNLEWNVTDQDDLPDGWVFVDNQDNSARFTWTPAFIDGRQNAYSPVFEVSDGAGGSDAIRIEITVNDVNRDPVIDEPTEDDEFDVEIAEGQELIIDFGAYDLDDDALEWAVSDDDDLPDGWEFTDNGDNTATFNWTPGWDDGRQDPYTPVFLVDDGRGGVDQIQVNITVIANQPPHITEPTEEDTYEVGIDEGHELVINLDAEDNEDDPRGWSMDEDGLPEGWEFTDNGDGSETFVWTPGFNDAENSPYTPVFTVTDDRGGEDVLSAVITVNESNRAPVVENPIGDVEIDEDSGENLIADLDDVFSDPDRDDLAYDVAVIEDLDFRLEDGHILYITPADNYNGASQVFITADDRPDGNRVLGIRVVRNDDVQSGTFSGRRSVRGVNDNPRWTPNRDLDVEHEFTLTVTPENDDPVWVDVPQQVRVNEGEQIEFQVTAEDVDLNYEGDNLTLEVTDWDGPDGLGADFEVDDEVSGTYTWQTEIGDAGVYDVTFQVEDDAGAVDEVVVQITVSSVLPSIFEPTDEEVYDVDFVEGLEGGILFGADDNDNDPEELEWAIDSGDLPDGWEFEDIGDGSAEFFWTPDFDAARQNPYIATFTVTDPDGNADEIEVHFHVENVLQDPVIVEPTDQDEWDVAVDEGVDLIINFRADDIDVGEVLVWSIADEGDLPEGWQFVDNEDRTARFSWTPTFEDGRQNPYDVLFRVDDPEQLFDEILVHITVNDRNRPPVVRQDQEIPDIVVDEDPGLQVIVDLDDVFEELDEGDAIAGYELQGDPAELNMDIDGENVLSYHPDDNFNIPGGVEITVIALDESGLPGQDVFRLTINPINDPPGGGNGQDGFDLLSPASGTVLDDYEATFSWEAAVDVDNDDVVYSVFVFVEHDGRDSTVQIDDLVDTEYFIEGLDTLLMALGIWETEVQATWWVSATDGVLDQESNQRWSVTIPAVTSVPTDENGLPFEYSLKPVYPNPFNPTTTIEFTLPGSADIRLSVWDASGRRIDDLVSGYVTGGRHVIQWDAHGMTAGIYIFTLEAGGKRFIRKGVLIR